MSKILIFTPTYGDRQGVTTLVSSGRALAGVEFDWMLCSGSSSPARLEEFEKLLENSKIQKWVNWEENRGQHHAMKRALEYARAGDYDWLCRVDDDLTFRTPLWLKRMVENTTWLHDLWTTQFELRYELRPAPWPISSPYIAGLIHPPPKHGVIENPQQPFVADLMVVLGGACRLHHMQTLRDYEPPLYAPLGRGDPEHLREYAVSMGVPLVRYPEIRVLHDTTRLEKQDTNEQRHMRNLGKVWCYLGKSNEEYRA